MQPWRPVEWKMYAKLNTCSFLFPSDHEECQVHVEEEIWASPSIKANWSFAILADNVNYSAPGSGFDTTRTSHAQPFAIKLANCFGLGRPAKPGISVSQLSISYKDHAESLPLPAIILSTAAISNVRRIKPVLLFPWACWKSELRTILPLSLTEETKFSSNFYVGTRTSFLNGLVSTLLI